MNPIKKSLTRNNTNKSNIYYEKADSNIQNKNSINKNRILNCKHNFIRKKEQNKENNLNFLNTYHLNCMKFNTDINFKNSNNDLIKTEENYKNTRNRIKANFNPFYYTNTINTNNNILNGKKPMRVISSIRRIISQKLNNISENSSTIINNKNNSKSNDSVQGNIINGNKYNYKKLACITNNSSKNKTSEYITPMKKNIYHLYYHQKKFIYSQ